MKKIISITLLLALVCSSASAKCYYADPASTDSKAQGTRWEQAVTINNLRKAFSALRDGDTIYIKGGTIRFSSVTDRWDIPKGITLIGGFDPAATGTVTALPQYPSATPTIFDGDINKDGKPSPGDAPALIRVNLENNTKHTCTIQGFDLINTYYDNKEDDTNDLNTYLAESSALRIICGTAYIKNCHMYNHITPINRGSQCVTVVGANAHLIDCELHDCICLSRGALVRSRSYFINKVESNPILPSLVLERCCLYNGYNMGSTTDSITKGEYGGAVHVTTGDIFAINSTFVNNSTYSKGGAIRASDGSNIGVISCTFGNNYALRCESTTDEKPNTYGSAFGLDYDCTFKFANTFIVDDKDNGTKKYTPFYSDSNDKNIEEIGTSGGHNVFGTIYYVTNGSIQKDLSAFYQSTDKYSASGAVQNFSTYFGSLSRLTNNGGCSNSILPLQMQNGDNVAHLQALADAWCPSWTRVDASLDQRGARRNVNVTCIGAAAYEGFLTPPCTITTNVNNPNYGYVTGAGIYEQGSVLCLTATPNNDYYFSHWSDGNTNNPRRVLVSQDSTFTAIFTTTATGICGDNLTWQYNNDTLTISGSGAMYDYSHDAAPWTRSNDSITDIVLSTQMTSIGSSAFENCRITSITIPASVSYIGNYAFANCTAMADIYCSTTTPATVAADEAFYGVSQHCYLHVPAGATRAYQMAIGWRVFDHIFELGALPSGESEVGVTVTDNYATFSWPVYPTASSYTLEIKKSGVLFCSLIFNSMGQLVGINFAPSRDSSFCTSDAEATEYGYSFMINGLDKNSTYDYTFAAKNKAGITLETQSGSFSTKDSPATALKSISFPSDESEIETVKVMKGNRLLILRDGKVYSVSGWRLLPSK